MMGNFFVCMHRLVSDVASSYSYLPEKTVESFILSAVQPMLDPLQFAHRAGRGAEDARL